MGRLGKVITKAQWRQAKRVCTKQATLRHYSDGIGPRPYLGIECDTVRWGHLDRLNLFLGRIDSGPAWDLCANCAAVYGVGW